MVGMLPIRVVVVDYGAQKTQSLTVILKCLLGQLWLGIHFEILGWSIAFVHDCSSCPCFRLSSSK